MRITLSVLACITLCSCAVFRTQPEWTDQWPTDPASPWNRTVDVAFSNAPLPRVITELEELANAQPGPKLSLGHGQLPAGTWDESIHPSLTFRAANVRVEEVFRIVGELTNHRAMFRGHDGLLAEHWHDHREVTIFITGFCIDAATGAPIKSPSISGHFEGIKPKDSGEFIHPVRVDGSTSFVECGGKNYLMTTEPRPEDIRFVITAPGYQPQELVISPHDSVLTYTNNIEMKRDIPSGSREVINSPLPHHRTCGSASGGSEGLP